jgi:hypothetical protein
VGSRLRDLLNTSKSWPIELQWILAAAGGIVAVIATTRPVCRVLAASRPSPEPSRLAQHLHCPRSVRVR